MQKLVQRLFLAAAVLILPGSAAATTILGDAVSLARLVEGGGTLQVGDKLFSDFDYSFTGDMPSALGVNVIPIIDDDGNWGIRFQGGFADLVGGDTSDALISFTVEATAEGFFITDAHLAGNPEVLGTTGLISVTEDFSNGADTLSIFANPNTEMNVAWNMFEPVKSLRVTKDIFAEAGDEGVVLSVIDQTFSQVPEPGTALLLGLGLSGLALAGRPRFN